MAAMQKLSLVSQYISELFHMKAGYRPSGQVKVYFYGRPNQYFSIDLNDQIITLHEKIYSAGHW